MINKLLNQNDVNINMDSDGLLSYLFLKKCGFKGEISGFNNSNDLILSCKEQDELWNGAFIDIFTPKQNALTVDQHIIMDYQNSHNYGINKINPHLIIEPRFANNPSYYRKYPFSTCIFLLNLFEKYGLIEEDLNLEQIIGDNGLFPCEVKLIDLILRADGIWENFIKYEKNVRDWYEKMITFSNHGKNFKKIFEYLFNLTHEECKTINDAVSEGYIKYGLKKDGGYNFNISRKQNINLLCKLLRAFAKYLNIELREKEVLFNVYKGEMNICESSNFNFIEMNKVDTYAFIGHSKLSFTTNIHITNEKEKLVIYE